MSAARDLVRTEMAHRPSTVLTLARWEYRNGVRSRWVLVLSAVFAVLCLTVTLLSFRSMRELGLTGIGPASATLVNLGVLLPSLMGLVLGAGALVGAREDGLLGMIAAQPVHRSRIALGVFAGLTGSLWTVLGVGFGAAMIVMSGVARSSDVPALVALIGATLGVAAASVAIGLALSSVASSRTQAIGGAVGVWIVLSLGVDLALAALAPSVHLGPGAMLTAVLLDPLEAARVLALLGTNLRGTALGPFGAYLIATFGTVGTVLVLTLDLIVWTALALLLAGRVVARRDL